MLKVLSDGMESMKRISPSDNGGGSRMFDSKASKDGTGTIGKN